MCLAKHDWTGPDNTCLNLLLHLFQHRHNDTFTYSALERLGGIKSYLADTAEQAWQNLPPPMKVEFESCLNKLIGLSPGGDTIAGKSRGALQHFSDDVQHQLISPFVEKGILLEVFHEDGMVISWSQPDLLQHWQRIQRWAQVNASDFYVQHDIKEGYHCFPQGLHLIFYRIQRDSIEVLGIPHKSMDIQDFFD